MAGKLTISTLNDSSGVLATQNGMTGIGKAWVNFNSAGGTVVLNDSFNVSSVTRNGTGDFTVNFTTSMPNANYVMCGVVGNGASSSDGTAWTVNFYTSSSITTSSCRFLTVYTLASGRGTFDPNPVTVAFFGD